MRAPFFPPRLREVVGLLMDGTGDFRGTPQPLQERVHPALGVADPPALLDPPPDLGRCPEPSGRYLLGHLRLLLGRQERGRPLTTSVTPLDGHQPAGSIPRQPALHR